mmetsp:Transcript_21551/g.83831  ORF Transcript_21551/g.83831 Transcript_21551/m.83831 type:complete len:210 (-) Transcript_21551:445-1074(-)
MRSRPSSSRRMSSSLFSTKSTSPRSVSMRQVLGVPKVFTEISRLSVGWNSRAASSASSRRRGPSGSADRRSIQASSCPCPPMRDTPSSGAEMGCARTGDTPTWASPFRSTITSLPKASRYSSRKGSVVLMHSPCVRSGWVRRPTGRRPRPPRRRRAGPGLPTAASSGPGARSARHAARARRPRRGPSRRDGRPCAASTGGGRWRWWCGP